MSEVPLLIEFIAETKLHRDLEVVPKLPIVQSGRPGTSVIFSVGGKVPLPTDQILCSMKTQRGVLALASVE